MPPPISTDPAAWFLNDRANPDTTLSVFTSANLVEPLVDAEGYFRKFHDLVAATTADDSVFFAAWRLDRDQQLLRGGTSASLAGTVFRDASWRNVDVRVILSNHVGNANLGTHGFFSVEMTPPRVRSMRDARYPSYGSAHQKFATILLGETLHAFCGGIDFAVDRFADATHDTGGWHDVHCYIQGPACRDVDISFRERWNDPRHSSVLDPILQVPILSPIPNPPAAGPHHVQVLRTYACGIGYPFATQGEFTSRRAILQAIALARDYIYIEDQFFVSYEVADALQAALIVQPLLFVLVVVAQEPIGVEGPFNHHQDVLIKKLEQAAPTRFAIYHLRNPNPGHLGEQIYVHSKVMIVDDVWVKIGSTNLARRDMAHDCQMDIAIVDDTQVDGVCKFARDFRIQLWAEHLALPASDPSLVDPRTGFDRWSARSGTPGVPAHAHAPGLPRWRDLWNTFIDPQKLCPADPRIPP